MRKVVRHTKREHHGSGLCCSWRGHWRRRPGRVAGSRRKEGALTWPLRDRYGLVEITGPTKILPDGWPELVRRSAKGAELLKNRAERLMAQEGIDVTASPWLYVGDDPDDVLPNGKG